MNKFGKTPAEVIGELHPLFKGLLFVSAARSDDENRAVLNHILVERQDLEYRIVATDGKRLHVHEFDPGMFDDDIEHLEPGLYEVIAKSSKFIVLAANDELNITAFPVWRKILPNQKLKHHDTINAKTISRIGIVTGTLLAADFTIEALGFGNGRKKDDNCEVEYAADPKGGPFMIKHDLGTAILMPMRMPDDSEEAPEDDDAATPEFERFAESFKVESASADFLASMRKAVGPGGSVEITTPGTGKGVKITQDKVVPINGKENPADER